MKEGRSGKKGMRIDERDAVYQWDEEWEGKNVSGKNIEGWKCTAAIKNSALAPEMVSNKQSDKL